MFKPNALKLKDIEGLEFWQLLVACCHFGSTMKDCVDLDYGYTKNGEDLFCEETNMRGDIDLKSPMEALEHYADFSLKSALKGHLTKQLILFIDVMTKEKIHKEANK